MPPPPDRVQDYISRAVPAFHAAREAAARLAGLLLTAELAASRHRLDHPSRESGLAALGEARDRLSGPVPETCAHFHHHLTQALTLLMQSWQAAESRRAGLFAAADALPPLQSAWTEMRHAARLLPGFQTVDFATACCALHGAPDRPASKGGNDARLFDLDP